MKKVNWEEVRECIFYLSCSLLIVFSAYSLAMVTIYLHDKYEPVKIFIFICFGLTVISVLGMIITSLVDFLCEHKKRKK